MNDKEPMTILGHKMLKEELQRLITKERPDVIRSIEEARGHGDLSENAEYDAAKERQAMIEGKIQQIQDKLARAQVIDTSSMKSEKITFGATVTLYDIGSEDSIQYKIVGQDESDIKKGKISVRSPIARALIGKQEGDEVVFQAPGGRQEYEVEKIDYF